MNQSDSIAKLAPALILAQAKIGNALKNKENPFHKSSYADLEAVWAAAAEPLKEHQLAVLQLPLASSIANQVALETILMHESGEYISSTLSLPCPKQDPQGYGSAITYARRYALASLLGIVQTDDDGEGAKDETAATTRAIDSITQCTDFEQLKKTFQSLYPQLNIAGKQLLTLAKDKKKEEFHHATA